MSELTASETCPQTVDELEERLSRPSACAIDALGRFAGDLIILGVGGKMGPTLARMARRASDAAGRDRRVIGVSRFSDPAARQKLESWGVETIAGDLLDEAFVQSLPDAPIVVYMAGFKFGASAQPWLTWAMNCYLPALVCRKFAKARIAAFSSGNVYGLVSTSSGGSRETDDLHPVGEYSMAALGRERTFEYFSRTLNIPTTILRLNYACELRYGVVVDLAQLVWAGQPIDVSMGCFNVIWQADANAMTLASLAHVANPPHVINVAGPEKLRVRDVCQSLAKRMGKPVEFIGQEGADAFLSDAAQGHEILGRPAIDAETIIEWAADWICNGRETLGKPTKFQSRDGKY